MASTGPAPHKVLSASHDQVDQRSSSWVVAISRYQEPASSYDPTGIPSSQQQLQIIENDVTGITITNSKSSFGKTASIKLKTTNVWYPSLVNNGDWICVWIHNNKSETDRITKLLQTVKNGGSPGTGLCDVNSGLKFVGRITNINTTDTVGGNGKRTITQNIQAQMFLELATSVYYIFKSPVALTPTQPPSQRNSTASGVSTQGLQNDLIENYQIRQGLDSALTDLAQKFLGYYKSKKPGAQSPDHIIALFFIIIMGINSDNETGVVGVKGTVNDGITQTKDISKILGKPQAQKLWELYNLNLGLQKYQKTGQWWEQFSPKFSEGDIIKLTPIRTKGFVPFTPTMWSNESMWSILTKYINSVCNEMFTCLRVNEQGLIAPTLVHREKPFSTGLFDHLTRDGKVDSDLKVTTEDNQSSTTSNPFDVDNTISRLPPQPSYVKPSVGSFTKVLGGSTDRTMYASLPRWVVDDSIVRSFSYSMDESRRINFVQVWGRNAGAEFTGVQLDPEKMKQSQLAAVNYYTDEVDVARHGLRAMILESSFDVYTSSDASGSLAPLWAKMNADWHFNGHLKASGNLTVNGIVEPVCEGDNLQIRDLVFHIEGVSHNCSIGANGKKSWTTSFQLSRGMLASGLVREDQVPLFITHGAARSYTQTQNSDSVPGITQVQNRITGPAQTEPSTQSTISSIADTIKGLF